MKRTWAVAALCLPAALPAHAAYQLILAPDEQPARAVAETPLITNTPKKTPAVPTLPSRPPGGSQCNITVEPGDSLGRLAKKHLGDRNRWGEIAELNQIRDPDRIASGWTLAIPCDKGRIAGEPGYPPRDPRDPPEPVPEFVPAEVTGTGAEQDLQPAADAEAAFPAESIENVNSGLRGQQGAAEPASPANGPEITELKNVSGADKEADHKRKLPCDAKPADRHCGVVNEPESAAALDTDTDSAADSGQQAANEVAGGGSGSDDAANAAQVENGDGRSAEDHPPAAVTQTTGPCSVVVERGQSLSALAGKHLGDGARWPEIAELNHIREPDRIEAGWELVLPCPGSRVAGVPEAQGEAAETETDPIPAAAGGELEALKPLVAAGPDPADRNPEEVPEPPYPGPATEGSVWKARSSDRLDDVIAGWALAAGWQPVISKRWFWRFYTDYSFTGSFEAAVEDVLRGFPMTGTAPGIVYFENQVLELTYR